MQTLHIILIDSFTNFHQQEYDKLLHFITITRQTIKHKLRHVYRWEIHWKKYNSKSIPVVLYSLELEL